MIPANYTQLGSFGTDPWSTFSMGNLKGMGPVQMLGTAYGAGDVGYSMFTKNNDLFWGPQALTKAMEGALTGLSIGGVPGAAVGGTLGYIGGKF